MMRRIYCVIICLLFFAINCHAQIDYSLKAEAGYLKYNNNTIQVDPGPGWKGYYLNRQNGFDVNIINGVSYTDMLFTGIGVGYMNFEGVSGFSIFPELEYVPLKSRLSPLVNLKIGYSHIWNQYENGTGTTLGELGLGFNYSVSENIDVYIKSGFLWMQQSKLIPFRVGFRF